MATATATNTLEALTWDYQAGGCCSGKPASVVAKYDHMMGIIRHSERVDKPDVVARLIAEGPPAGRENEWPWGEGVAKPFEDWNPPISDHGIEEVQKYAKILLRNFQQGTKQLRGQDMDINKVVIVTSPLRRAVMSALEISKVFGCTIMIDYDLLEMYSEQGMLTPKEPQLPDRLDIYNEFPEGEFEQATDLGEAPKWGEDWNKCRTRYGKLLQRYLDRGAATQTDFIMCCHGDLLPLALNLCKPETWMTTDMVTEYNAYCLITRTAQLSMRPKDLEAIKGQDVFDVVPEVVGFCWLSENLSIHIPDTSPFKYKVTGEKKVKSLNESMMRNKDYANPTNLDCRQFSEKSSIDRASKKEKEENRRLSQTFSQRRSQLGDTSEGNDAAPAKEGGDAAPVEESLVCAM